MCSCLGQVKVALVKVGQTERESPGAAEEERVNSRGRGRVGMGVVLKGSGER